MALDVTGWPYGIKWHYGMIWHYGMKWHLASSDETHGTDWH
jgi:hypothetical protein